MATIAHETDPEASYKIIVGHQFELGLYCNRPCSPRPANVLKQSESAVTHVRVHVDFHNCNTASIYLQYNNTAAIQVELYHHSVNIPVRYNSAKIYLEDGGGQQQLLLQQATE